MPTVLMMLGWRLFFYANEQDEPPHIHCRKGDCECKFWFHIEEYEILEAYTYNLSPRDKREIKKIIYKHFDYLISEWERFQEEENG